MTTLVKKVKSIDVTPMNNIPNNVVVSLEARVDITTEHSASDIIVGSVLKFITQDPWASLRLSGSWPRTPRPEGFFGLVLQTSPHITIKDLKTNKIYDEYEIKKQKGYLEYKL